MIKRCGAAIVEDQVRAFVENEGFVEVIPMLFQRLAFDGEYRNASFGDGRAYSYARLLRERHGYRGELRAGWARQVAAESASKQPAEGGASEESGAAAAATAARGSMKKRTTSATAESTTSCACRAGQIARAPPVVCRADVRT